MDRGFLYFAIAFGIILVLWAFYLWRDFYSSKSKRRGLSLEDKAAALVMGGGNEGAQAGILEIRKRHPELTVNDCKVLYYRLLEEEARAKYRVKNAKPGTGVSGRSNAELQKEKQAREHLE
ncbi:hypothetical protein ACU19_04240 [Actinobaculum suis]|nr:hypothetical protein ACU19_04240 [Actinobaculum suis]